MTEAAAGQSGPARSARRRFADAILVPLMWPVALLRLPFNPILTKELRVASRLRRHYLLRFLYVALMLFVISLALYEVYWSSRYYQSTAARIESWQDLGGTLSLTLGWVQLVVIMFIGPVLTSAAISDEIEDRTLDVLLIAPFSNGQILLGKITSRFMHILMLILLGVPVLVGMRYFGGFELERLLEIEALCVTTALTCLAAGLFASSWSRQAWRAVAFAYVILLALWALLPLGAAGLLEWMGQFRWSGPIWSGDFEDWLMVISTHGIPPMTLGMLSVDTVGIGFLPIDVDRAWLFCNALNLGVAGLLILGAMPAVRRRTRIVAGGRSQRWLPCFARRRASHGNASDRESIDEVEIVHDDKSRLVANDRSSNEAGRDAGVESPELPARRSRRRRRVSDRPVLWRELRLKLLETRLQRVIGLIAILLLAAWFYWQAKPWKDEEWHVLPIFLGLSLHLLLACLYGSVAITVEKQESNWETLLCTPLTPSQILWPKFLGVFRRTAAPSAFVLLHLIVFSMASLIPFWLVIHYTMIAFSFAAFLCAVGLALSLHCGRSRSAMVSTLSVAIGLWGAPLIGLLIVAEFLGLYNETEAAARVLFSINPFAWMGAAAEPAAFSPRAMRLEYYEFVTDGTVSPARFTFMLTMASGAAFGLAMLIVSGLISGFNRVVGRTS